MAATKALLDARVGEGGAQSGAHVRQLQQLLLAIGADLGPTGADGGWGSRTKDALMAFQKKCRETGLTIDGEKIAPDTNVVVRAWAEPNDACLFYMARLGGMLIPLAGKSGTIGVKAMHDWFVDHNIKYQSGAEKGEGTRACFGLAGREGWALQTLNGAYAKGPVQMDCTTYVNFMLGIFARGNLHGAPYDASTPVGWVNTMHLARDRYLFPLVRRHEDGAAEGTSVNFFRTAEQIEAATSTGNLYVIELAGTVKNPSTGVKMHGAVTHMVLLYNGQTYECTNGRSGPACINRSLEELLEAAAGKIVYLFGPRAAG
jgi:hypothetical protein